MAEEELKQKARNFFILGRIAERIGMKTESASNYFKSLTVVNNFKLSEKNFRVKNHSERFRLLKENFPNLYLITDKLFSIYRRTYTEELSSEEIESLRKNIEEAFKNAGIDIPTDEEITNQTKKFSKK